MGGRLQRRCYLDCGKSDKDNGTREKEINHELLLSFHSMQVSWAKVSWDGTEHQRKIQQSYVVRITVLDCVRGCMCMFVCVTYLGAFW